MLTDAQDLDAVAGRFEHLARLTLGDSSEKNPKDGHAGTSGLSQRSVADLRSPQSFSDENGNARRVDCLLLSRIARRLGVPQDAHRQDHAHQHSGEADEPTDTRLWRALALAEQSTDLRRLLAEPSNNRELDIPTPALAQTEGVGLEVWTESELIGLHALWWMAHERQDPWLSRRVDRARSWLIEQIQPDNATNTPWAVHVFAIAASEFGDAASDLFAGQLVHNSMVGTGAPDRRSAWVLLDAAAAIRVHISSRRK